MQKKKKDCCYVDSTKPLYYGTVIMWIVSTELFCDWEKERVLSATSVSVWQYVQLPEQNHP